MTKVHWISSVMLLTVTVWMGVLAVIHAPGYAYYAPLAVLLGFVLGVFHERFSG